MKDLIGKQVHWEKVQGKAHASMRNKTGFGVLARLDLDGRMTIAGDYGITTSIVRAVESVDDGVKVTTLNSVYLVKAIN